MANSCILCFHRELLRVHNSLSDYYEDSNNRPLPSSKNPHFQSEAKCTENEFYLHESEWKIISISKAEHLTSSWYRGLGELGNGLLTIGMWTRAILGNRASYAHASIPVSICLTLALTNSKLLKEKRERVPSHFLWDPGPTNLKISRQKVDFVT